MAQIGRKVFKSKIIIITVHKFLNHNEYNKNIDVKIIIDFTFNEHQLNAMYLDFLINLGLNLTFIINVDYSFNLD